MDASIEYLVGKIQNALAVDPRVNKQDVRITICSGKVHLLGRTSTEQRRRAIGEVVAEIAPDLELRNELTVVEVNDCGAPEIIRD